jgi:hypothetical protein
MTTEIEQLRAENERLRTANDHLRAGIRTSARCLEVFPDCVDCGQPWHILMTVGTPERMSEVMAAHDCDGIGVLVRARRQPDDTWKRRTIDTERMPPTGEVRSIIESFEGRMLDICRALEKATRIGMIAPSDINHVVRRLGVERDAALFAFEAARDALPTGSPGRELVSTMRAVSNRLVDNGHAPATLAEVAAAFDKLLDELRELRKTKAEAPPAPLPGTGFPMLDEMLTRLRTSRPQATEDDFLDQVIGAGGPEFEAKVLAAFERRKVWARPLVPPQQHFVIHGETVRNIGCTMAATREEAEADIRVEEPTATLEAVPLADCPVIDHATGRDRKEKSDAT